MARSTLLCPTTPQQLAHQNALHAGTKVMSHSKQHAAISRQHTLLQHLSAELKKQLRAACLPARLRNTTPMPACVAMPHNALLLLISVLDSRRNQMRPA